VVMIAETRGRRVEGGAAIGRESVSEPLLESRRP
jgi:hypothetical protein